MESNENRDAAKSKAKAAAPVGRNKPPTRLQKRAPALQIDPTSNINETAASNSFSAIPLLSPLVVSPMPMPMHFHHHQQPMPFHHQQPPPQGEGDQEDHQQEEGGIGGGGDGGGGWQHPAVVESFPDPSTLFSFFQSQCVLVNRVQ